MTNLEFSKKDPIFAKACEIAKTPITMRQASKYRSNRGLAYSVRREAIECQVEDTAKALMAKDSLEGGDNG